MWGLHNQYRLESLLLPSSIHSINIMPTDILTVPGTVRALWSLELSRHSLPLKDSCSPGGLTAQKAARVLNMPYAALLQRQPCLGPLQNPHEEGLIFLGYTKFSQTSLDTAQTSMGEKTLKENKFIKRGITGFLLPVLITRSIY